MQKDTISFSYVIARIFDIRSSIFIIMLYNLIMAYVLKMSFFVFVGVSFMNIIFIMLLRIRQLKQYGHGVGLRGDKILDVPKPLIFAHILEIILYSTLTILDITAYKTSYFFAYFGSSIVLTHIVSIIHWYLHTRHQTYYLDENITRKELEQMQGISSDTIDQKIDSWRDKGYFG